MTDSAEYRMTCPSCGETLVVDDSMRAALVENGCVVCGGNLSGDAFAPHREREDVRGGEE